MIHQNFIVLKKMFKLWHYYGRDGEDDFEFDTEEELVAKFKEIRNSHRRRKYSIFYNKKGVIESIIIATGIATTAI